MRFCSGLARLSDPHRRVLDMHYRTGLSYKEIARELGVPIGTVMSRIHRARSVLKDEVQSMEENPMAGERDLAARFQMEIDLLEALKAEADAADGIRKVKYTAEPMVRLRQVLETHPPRLIDLLRISDSDERVQHLAGVARHAMQATMPVMASCCLSNDEVLLDRSTRMAEFWVVNPGNYGIRALSQFVDAVIGSPAEPATKARLVLRLIQAIRRAGMEVVGSRLIGELTCVLVGYPTEAFPLLWEALWEVDEDDKVEYGVRKAIGHHLEPFTDAAMDVVRSGDRERILFLLAQIRPIFSSRSPFGPAMPKPKRLYQELRVLLDSDDPEIVDKAKSIGVGRRRIDVSELIARSEDPSAHVRANAIRELGARVEVSAKHVFLERIETDEDFDVRKAAVQAYGRVAETDERQACLEKISRSRDQKLLKAAARALYAGTGPRQRTALEEKRIQRIRGDAEPKKHIDPILALRSLPEIREYEEEELTSFVARVCTDYSITRRQMVMEGRHSLMIRESGVYSFTQIGEAVWRVGQFIEGTRRKLGTVTEDKRGRIVGAPFATGDVH